jgi:site-specific DNA-methyltransferase (adenine-specific)
MIQLPTESEPVTIVEGDCLDVLRTLPDGCVDAVVTDPPYGLDFPYASYTDTRDNLRALVAGFMPESRRVASRVYVTPGQSQVGLYPPADWLLAVVWNTTGSFGAYGYSQWMPVLAYGKDLAGFGRINKELKADVLTISGGNGVGFQRGDEKEQHPCPKPLNVMRKLIRRLTNPGDIVLDPFGGSGTTAVACVIEGRRAILIEREPAYAAIARRRVAEAMGTGLLAGLS